MNEKFPRISVVVPSFNQCNFLEQTLKSILYQKYPNLELIVVDGGSTDGSVEVIKQFEKQIRYWVSEKDNGQVSAINKGISQCTGEWIAFQNSDDIYIGDTFFKLAAAVRQFPGIDLFFGDMFIIDAESNYQQFQRNVSFDIKYQRTISHQIHNQSMFFHRRILEKVGLFNEKLRFSFDFEFVFKLRQHNISTCRVPGMYGAFRHHTMAKSSTIVDVCEKENNAIYQQFDKTLGLTSIDKQSTRLKYYISKICSITVEPGWLAYFWTLKKYYESELAKINHYTANN